MSLQVKGLNKEYEGMLLYSNFDIDFTEGTITCILGPSGCGKTTLLNIIGGTVKPDSGTLVGFDKKVISYIFQEPRLLPWRTVEQNIEFVLGKNIASAEKKKIVRQFIQLVELDGFEKYYPSKLSGGMRQRVSIARSFAYPSDIILMDEALKGLDVKLKQNLIRTFSRIWQADRRTVIFVTHDVDEALMLGNEVIVFSEAPVQVVMRQKVEVPLANRTIETDYFKALKQDLIKALGS
ncbi:MAG TPA: ATP-binding cassette domain-containing protein [Tenuifilaceae bacterium]|nr:ATP-binding cassette domain-containing protein [Tenuifilaceae bacterium]